MGEVREKITLANAVDVANVGRGYMPETEVRQMTVEAVVDTGAWLVVMNDGTREQLGLAAVKDGTARLADGKSQPCKITEPVDVYWKDRFTTCRAMVLPGVNEVLLGCIPLEDMDLSVNLMERRLEGTHGDEWVRYVR